MDEVWYRYEDVTYAPMADEFGDRHGVGSIEIRLREYRVIKHTPKGAWVALSFGDFSMIGADKRFVLRGAHRRFACPTKEEAAASFRARKKRQISIHQARMHAAQRALEVFEHELSHGH